MSIATRSNRSASPDRCLHDAATMLAYDYVNDFNLYGKTYHVRSRRRRPFAKRPETSASSTCEALAASWCLSPLVRTTSAPADSRQPVQRLHVSSRDRTPGPGKSSGQMLDAGPEAHQGQVLGHGGSASVQW